ncbi:MAG TPA: hypothetical protein VIZ68_03415 [Thermoplasmata archaeon]
MSSEPVECALCHAIVPAGHDECPQCGTPVATEVPRAAAPAAVGVSELTRRVARLQQWAESAEPLEVTLPSLPAWAEEAGRNSANPDPWLDVLRGVERIAQRKIVTALEAWEKQTRLRLTRLEAYSVDGRLERDQIDDVLHTARGGDITQALQTFHQVDRVVALKERHLDQAREELERLVSLLRDMQALGLPTALDPAQVSEELERELRAGRLASLKQQLRSLRLQAMNRLRVGVPEYVTRYGEVLVRERNDGTPVELEAAELARAAREFARGHPEEALRRLRVLVQVHGIGLAPSSGRPDPGATESSRRT